jgi:CheY-specific phosphatase CheX
LIEVITKTTGISLQSIPGEAKEGLGDLTGIMRLDGQNGGIILISVSEANIRTLCSYMIGIPQSEVTWDEMEDALCEIVNMTAGNIKVRLGNSEYAITLSMPFVIAGQKMTLATKHREKVIAVHLGNDELSIELRVICRNDC